MMFVTGTLFLSGRWWSSSTSLLETRTAGWWCFLEQEECSQQVGVHRHHARCRNCFILCPCPGIDLMDMASDILQPKGEDTARISWNLRKKIAKYQETFSVIEQVSHEERRIAQFCYTADCNSSVTIFFSLHPFAVSQACGGCRPRCLYWRR